MSTYEPPMEEPGHLPTMREVNDVRMAMLSKQLLTIAAGISVRSPLGWAHPDCAALEEAARIVRGEPEKKPDDGRAIGVLSQK